jgi:hypothetical protein
MGHILAHQDDSLIVVNQAYQQSIGRFAIVARRHEIPQAVY